MGSVKIFGQLGRQLLVALKIERGKDGSTFKKFVKLQWFSSIKRGWPELPHSPSRSIHGILLLQTNTLALLLHLRIPRLLWSSSLPLALHFKLQCFYQNTPIISPQHMSVPSHSILSESARPYIRKTMVKEHRNSKLPSGARIFSRALLAFNTISKLLYSKW